MNHFVVIEGLDGVGKTMLSELLSRKIGGATINPKEVWRISEPFRGGVGWRELSAHRHGFFEYSQKELALLFAANRMYDVNRRINPFLTGGENRVLLCDRYYLSSMVYQQAGTFGAEEIFELNKHARHPDFIIVLTAPIEILMQRMLKRPEQIDRYERNLENLIGRMDEAVDILRSKGIPCAVVDATPSAKKVSDEAYRLLGNVLGG